jgi:hypothetical protein
MRHLGIDQRPNDLAPAGLYPPDPAANGLPDPPPARTLLPQATAAEPVAAPQPSTSAGLCRDAGTTLFATPTRC